MTPADRRRVDVLGCPIDCVSLQEVVEAIRSAARDTATLRIVTANVDFVMMARRDPPFRALLSSADLVVADGVPLLWAAALRGDPLAGRVNGTDLVCECAKLSDEIGFPVAFVGAAPGVAARAADRLVARFPRAEIQVVDTPYPLSDASSQGVAHAIRAGAARIALVALGAPKQEEWIQRYLTESGAAVGIGIGSAFDILSGDRPRAPRWMREHGLEWLHRTLQEPRRLGPRYLVEDSPFLLLALREALKARIGLRSAADDRTGR